MARSADSGELVVRPAGVAVLHGGQLLRSSEGRATRLSRTLTLGVPPEREAALQSLGQPRYDRGAVVTGTRLGACACGLYSPSPH